MNKMMYLERLEACLKWKIPKAEVDDIMRDYAEYFEEGRRQSKTDTEICAKLGDPEIVAKQLIEESLQQKKEQDYTSTIKREAKEKVKGNFSEKTKGFLKKCNSGIASVIRAIISIFSKIVLALLFSVLAAVVAFLAAAGIFVNLCGFFILVMLCFASVLIMITGFTLILISGSGFLISAWTGLLFLSGSFVIFGLGVCLLCMSLYLAQKFYKMSCRLVEILITKLKKLLFSFKDILWHKKRKTRFRMKIKNPNVVHPEKETATMNIVKFQGEEVGLDA